MREVFDAFWRACAYCLHPRVVLWSMAPLLLMCSALGVLSWLYWEAAVAAVRGGLEQWALVGTMLKWLDSVGLKDLHMVLSPLIVVALMVPVVVLVSLLLVALIMTPAIVNMVSRRRFSKLQRLRGGTWLQGLAWSLACTAAAVLALAASLPLWLVPPLVMVLPPLIWGWLTYRVLTFDVLAEHASAAERRMLTHNKRWPLLVMGVTCGFLGAAPSVLWALSAFALIFAPVFAVVSVWLYTLVFAFAVCWFAHYALAELQALRSAASAAVTNHGPPTLALGSQPALTLREAA